MITDPHNTARHPLLLFDGVCNLCNGFVQFIIRRDPKGVFRFAPLQSEVGRYWMERSQLSPQDLSTVLLVDDGRVYAHSDVALRMLPHLSGAWSLLSALRYIPKGWRDAIYNWIARHRYQWFGQRDQCMIPTPELKERFL